MNGIWNYEKEDSFISANDVKIKLGVTVSMKISQAIINAMEYPTSNTETYPELGGC